MTNSENKPALRPAFEVLPGSVVVLEVEGAPAVFVKAERIGKEYIHHYAVQLHPKTEGPLGMVYLDPEDEVFDTAMGVHFQFGEGCDSPPEAGHAFENAKGHFIKVNDDPKSQKMFGFIECSTGIICRRQERAVTAVYTSWRAECTSGSETVAIEEAFSLFEKLKA